MGFTSLSGYQRVIPRDLFNEGNLLKCLGKLAIETERYRNVSLDHDGEPFDIQQCEDDGSLTVENVVLTINGRSYHHYRPLNSRFPWPLYVTVGEDIVPVFTEHGQLTENFLSLINL